MQLSVGHSVESSWKSGVAQRSVVDDDVLVMRKTHPSGDVLVAVDGKAVTDSASMLNLIAALKPGSETTLRLMREAKAVELRVTVGKRPPKQVRKE